MIPSLLVAVLYALPFGLYGDDMKPAHECPDWDFMFIYPFSLEMECCMCDQCEDKECTECWAQEEDGISKDK